MSTAHSEPIHLLHIDDDPSFVDLLRDVLEAEFDRFVITSVTDPEDGIEALEGEAVDCVVSDYDMPGKNGLEVLDAVRADHPNLPFILFTGKGSEEIASDAISRGVTDYLQKQPGLDQFRLLAKRVENAVAKARAEEEVDRTRDWFATLLSNIADYVFVVDPNGQISYCSPSIERVMGYTPDEVTGESAFEFAHPEDVEMASEAFAEVLEQPDEEVRLNFRATHKDGSLRDLEVRGRNLLDNPVIQGIVVNARDVSDY